MSNKYQTICIVDDDLSVCKALGRIIKTAGFRVISYNSAQELLEDNQLESIDLLLLDIKIPVTNGFMLQENLVANDFNIPCIFMTAHDIENALTKAKEKGAVAFLQKPIDEKDLFEAIDKGLK